MISKRLPEREFFFGVVGTLRADYLHKIIEDANKARFKADENDLNKDYIMVGDEWY